ncbi:Antibiotic efflux pump outer membrane protein ArpC precursor [Candidatus Pseudomonas adelgestsugas]|uniref:Antibiotic efflux pump outer membrane protein ArpC n=1 Tax=Candidatus Pseudomonas adelgestsugas TaxID=1302376 RepID=A0ABX5R9S8_9PSED|nr:efflux transporter outer membrane subunit [Candidatus Pseudomonas adelgestsugas]QAX82056.1 Antibiotic efflux pump outer membrane protein ArpC precursor [Candidatus Pseudomonas adelgestsugas]
MNRFLFFLAVILFLFSGCSLTPDYQRPKMPVATQYPHGQAYSLGQAAADQGWRHFFRDPSLQQLIQTALANNRDLHVASLNIDAYAAQYQIKRANLFPTFLTTSAGSHQRVPDKLLQTSKTGIIHQYSTNFSIDSYELDLLNRVHSLSEEALQKYLATEEARRSIHISLVASVANAYLTWQTGKELLKLTIDTLSTLEQGYKLTLRSNEVGMASALDVTRAHTFVENTRIQLAHYTRQVAQDENSLTMLLSTELPASIASKPLLTDLLSEVPAGLPSDLLQRRPDIMQAEYNLKAANANIGTARAAFFPSVRLTTSAGIASPSLSSLFKGNLGTWSFIPQVYIPIFSAGSLRASLDYSKIQKEINVANYEKAIQTGFQEVSNGLAARNTYKQQLDAQYSLVAANKDYYRLAKRRYHAGIDRKMTFLDAKRQLFNAQQSLITARLEQLKCEVNLYKALGGGWNEQTTKNELLKK